MSGVHDEVDRNFAAFQGYLPDILQVHAGEYALLHDARIIDYYADALSATHDGVNRFGRGAFSVQEVSSAVDSLGFYSYVGVSGNG